MTAYLVHYVDIAKDLQVLKFAESKLAEIYSVDGLEENRTAKIVESEDSFRDRIHFSTALLVAIYNGLGPDKFVVKFENHDSAARRTFALLYAKFNQLELTPVEPKTAVLPDHVPPPVSDPSDFPEPDKEISTVAKPAKKVNSTGVARGTGSKPAGLVAEFKQAREGTDRAKVLKLMDGTKTPDQIAAKMGGGDKWTSKYVMAHAYCLHRDCAIGYSLSAEGKLSAVYPGKKTFADAIKPLAEKPAKKAAKKAPAEATA